MTGLRYATVTRPASLAGLDRDVIQDWRDRAACMGKITAERDPWHPVEGAQSVDRAVRAAAYAEARAICDACPVRDACLIDALSRGGEDGMRGGLEPGEQRSAVRAQGRNPRRRRVIVDRAPVKAPVKPKHVAPPTQTRHRAADVAAAVEAMIQDGQTDVRAMAASLDMTIVAVGRACCRADRPDLGRPFQAAAWHDREARRRAER